MAETQPEGPVWLVVRATVALPHLPRGHMATVDVTLPEIQNALRATWIVPLPANEQPKLTTDPATLLPIMEDPDAE